MVIKIDFFPPIHSVFSQGVERRWARKGNYFIDNDSDSVNEIEVRLVLA